MKEHNIMTLEPLVESYFDSFKVQYHLSNRETEIFMILSLKGYSNQQIGNYLHISENTVRNHINRILKKTKSVSTRELQALLLQDILTPFYVKGLQILKDQNSETNKVIEYSVI